MSVTEYYSNTPYQNFCKWLGYMDRIDRDTENYRRLAYITHASMSAKPLTINKLWPARIPEKSESLTMSKEMLENIIRSHGLDPNKVKHA